MYDAPLVGCWLCSNACGEGCTDYHHQPVTHCRDSFETFSFLGLREVRLHRVVRGQVQLNFAQWVHASAGKTAV